MTIFAAASLVAAMVWSFVVSPALSAAPIHNETAVSPDSTIHLPCAVAAQIDDVTSLAWYKRHTTIWEDLNYFTTEHWDSSKYGLVGVYDLLINNVSFRDAGEYRCVRTDVETDESVTNKWTVHVLGHSRCHVSSPDGVNFIREGHNITLECNLRFAGSSKNRPNVTWQTAGESATLGDTRPPAEEGGKTVQNLLNITVTKEDENRE